MINCTIYVLKLIIFKAYTGDSTSLQTKAKQSHTMEPITLLLSNLSTIFSPDKKNNKFLNSVHTNYRKLFVQSGQISIQMDLL